MDSLPQIQPVALPLPLVAGKVPCGFPAPADDFLAKRLDLNDLLITHPQATFFWQASGDSMREAGIFSDDILVVNRALSPRHGHIVVAQVDSDFTVKRQFKRAGRIRLEPANWTFPAITFKDDQQLIICGVVVAAIKRFVRG